MIGYLTKEQTETILLENDFGRIGCNDGYNTYIFPTNYVFDGKYIYCHSYIGAKIMTMRDNRRVCFQVEVIKDAVNWKSVMVQGRYEELDDERDRYYAMKAFNDHMFNLKISEKAAFPRDAGHENDLYPLGHFKPVIYRISIDELTGRFEQKSTV